MAQNAPYGHIDPPPEACVSSQDTVEDLDLYKDQLCVPPDAKQSDTDLSSAETSSAQASPSVEVELIAMKAQIQELERNIVLQAGRISALEEHNQLFKRILTDFEECFGVLGQRLRERKQAFRNESNTEAGKGDDFKRKSMKRVRFM